MKKTPYEKYRQTFEWDVIENAINDLVDNNDIEIKTPTDNVIGYISKQIVDRKEKITSKTEIILSANRALWGAVTIHLRGVTFDYQTNKVTLRAYFDKGATEEDKELINDALGEILADFPEISECHYEPVDRYYPLEMTVLNDWLYLRHENFGEEE